MFHLTDQHLDEIAAIPPLMDLVHAGTVNDKHMEKFVTLCVQHKCPQTFLHVVPGPLTVLARLNGVDLAQSLDFSDEHPEAWKRAARRAAKEGHEEFVRYIFSQIDTDTIRKSAVTGACMGDHPQLLSRFAPGVEDPTFYTHIAPLAAQHSAIKCLTHLVHNMSSRVWLSTMAVASLNDSPAVLDLLMDNIPPSTVPTQDWCVKVALRVVNKERPHRVLDFALQHTTAAAIIELHPNMSDLKQERLKGAHQRVVLTQAVSTTAIPSKRKM